MILKIGKPDDNQPKTTVIHLWLELCNSGTARLKSQIVGEEQHYVEAIISDEGVLTYVPSGNLQLATKR